MIVEIRLVNYYNKLSKDEWNKYIKEINDSFTIEEIEFTKYEPTIHGWKSAFWYFRSSNFNVEDHAINISDDNIQQHITFTIDSKTVIK